MTTYESVKKEIFIQVSPKRVWQALIIPSERNKWETNKCEIDLRVGGKIELDYGWGVDYSGTITEVVENERLVIQGSGDALTIWTITPQNNGSLVTIEYTGLWSGDIGIMEMENMAFGTYQFLKNFKSVLESQGDIRQTFWISWIGVYHRSAESEGVKVVKVVKDTPGDGKIKVGDIILSLNGTEVNSYDELESIVTEIGAGKDLALDIVRGGERVDVHITTVPYGQKVEPTCSLYSL
ncbi:SRPBCC family protein [Evansella halocellulosilytica]|uniref:SRPBCC family protein n=1 Tax=Evansella halocellulosilytica TaxID=2011013 RepID=UPI000BB81179|nr:SRPBCC domain-containing protein [Evansella halocellulosilytica]